MPPEHDFNTKCFCDTCMLEKSNYGHRVAGAKQERDHIKEFLEALARRNAEKGNFGGAWALKVASENLMESAKDVRL